MRKRLFEVIDIGNDNDVISKFYDVIMMVVIVISLVPLAIKSENQILNYIDMITTIIFLIDYILRWITSDYKIKKGISSFVLYPFTLMALLDLISILPSIIVINKSFRLLKSFRLIRTLRVLRVVKGFKYSSNIIMLINVFKKQKDNLIVVAFLSIGYVLISALLIINVEPETFDNYFYALYWATVSLTTVGYGDIYAVSVAGQVITMISSLLGIAVVALPSGIIITGYLEELDKKRNNKDDIDDIDDASN